MRKILLTVLLMLPVVVFGQEDEKTKTDVSVVVSVTNREGESVENHIRQQIQKLSVDVHLLRLRESIITMYPFY